MNQEQRQDFDSRLANIELSFRHAPAMSPTPTGRPRKVPAWWKGDAAATESNLAAARQLGYSLGGGTG